MRLYKYPIPGGNYLAWYSMVVFIISISSAFTQPEYQTT